MDQANDERDGKNNLLLFCALGDSNKKLDSKKLACFKAYLVTI